MAESSTAETVSKFGVGLGVGFALYWLIRNLGFGGGARGRGEGRVEDEGEGEGEGALEQMARAEIERLKQLAIPSIPPDPKRLLFRVKSGAKTKGRPILLLDGQAYQLAAAIARVKLGRRNDVELILLGDALQGDIDASIEGFRRAGIEPHIRDAGDSPPVSGNARGQYGVRGYGR